MFKSINIVYAKSREGGTYSILEETVFACWRYEYLISIYKYTFKYISIRKKKKYIKDLPQGRESTRLRVLGDGRKGGGKIPIQVESVYIK